MQDPYETLGIARDASDADIKAAYRRGCSEAHPDKHGGDGRRMQEINDAYAILSDPARRARFDASGDTTPRGRHMENARAILANTFARIIEQDNGADPIMELKANIAQMRSQGYADRQALSQRIRFMERKMRSLKGPEHDNFLSPVIEGKLTQMRRQLLELDSAIESFALCEEIVGKYSWSMDAETGFAAFLSQSGGFLGQQRYGA
jgi:curved DNA-binding protein CbpA